MKTKNFLIILLILIGLVGHSQVKDISVTLSPAAEFTWWDNHAGLNDGVLVGGKLGFGFGEFVELRGVYLQSYDLTTNFDNFGLSGYRPGLFTPQDVTLTRYGGEFKANIGTHRLKPYVTLGTGIQNLEIPDGEKFEQIYASAGIGLKVNLFPRAVLLLEGKNTTYNFNAGSNLLTSTDKTNFGTNEADFTRERLSNWSVQGALQFYLGGRRPGTLTDLDRAYLNQFRGGLRGVQPIIEPGAAYIAFNENSLFRDTWLVGGYAGVDFNEYIGLRGFYFQATESKDINTDFDDLAMYGLEFRARLNDGNGVTPYLTLGGGYLDPTDNYLGKDGATVKGGEFATGGLGLNVPLGKRVVISGGARAMLTSGESALDISMPDEIQTHIMYNAGVKFILGRKSKSPETIYQDNLNRDVDSRMAANNMKVQQMKNEYQQKVNELEFELAKANEANDVEKAIEIIEEKDEVQKSLKQVEKLELVQNRMSTDSNVAVQEAKGVESVAPQSVIQISPTELESLIVNILKTIQETPQLKSNVSVSDSLNYSHLYLEKVNLLNQRIDLLEKLLLEINSQKVIGAQLEQPENQRGSSISDNSRMILDKLDELDRKIERNTDKISNEENKAQTIVVTPVENANNEKDAYITAIDNKGKIQSNQKVTEIGIVTEPMLAYKNSSAMLGFNVGGAATTNIGARLHYDIHNLPMEFMPEIYFGFGSSNSFGISGNVVYPITLKSEKIQPYVGVGLGIARINRTLRGNYNVIIGTILPFISEKLSIDYTMRNSFDYNQLAVIYRLPF